MSDLPEQVRKQSEAVKAHFGAPAKPVVEDADNVQQQDSGEPNHVAPPADSAPVAPGPKGEQPEDPNSETYKARYQTLQGIHQAELSRERQRIRQLEELLAALPAVQPAEQPQQQNESVAFVSEKEREEYGDSISVMRNAAREEVYPVFNRLQQLESTLNGLVSNFNQQIVPQVQQVAQRQAETAHDRFWAHLDSAVPNWRQMNSDPDFQSWLLDTDPLTGVQRQTHLEQAQQSLQASRVAAFFNTFSGISGKSNNATAQSHRSAQSTELEKQVAPGRSRGTSAPTGQTTQTYSRGDIAKFFDDVRSGKYKGREAERNRIERDIFAAQAERRITG